MKAVFYIILIIQFLGGCGYTTTSILPPGENSVYVENFVNKIDITQETTDARIFYNYRPALETDITKKVIDKFISDGNFELRSQSQAHYILKGELISFARDPLRYDANENVEEFRLRIVINLEWYDRKNGKLLWEEKGFAGESTYRTSGQFAKSEATAIDEAIDDLARRIVERAVENW